MPSFFSSSMTDPATPRPGAARLGHGEKISRWGALLWRALRQLKRRVAAFIPLDIRLQWVIFLAVAPVLALIVHDHRIQKRAEIHRVSEESILTARLAAAGGERLLEGTRHLLVALSQLKDLRGPDGRVADRTLREFLARYPHFLNIGVIDASGRVFASALPYTPGLDLSRRDYFQQAIAQNDFVVGVYQIGAITDRQSLNCAFPIRDAAGRPVRVAYAALDPAWLAQAAEQLPLPRDTRLVLLDRRGTVVAARPPGAATLGEITPAFHRALSPPLGSTREAWLIEDADLLRAVAPVRLPAGAGLTALFEIPRRSAYRQVNRRLYTDFGLLVFSAFLVILLGRTAGRWFITRHVTALLDATRRLARGDMTARTGITGGPRELGQMALAIDHLAQALEKREEELRHIHADLERQVMERTQELRATNEQLETFSTSVSHDLRAPLRAIDGFSQILLNEHAAGLSPEGQRLLGVVVKNTRQMNELIEDLLTFARLGREHPAVSPIDMKTLAQNIFYEQKALQPERGAVHLRAGPTPGALGDPAMVHQVWVNLLSNALKFTSSRGNAWVEIGGERDGGWTRFWVKDNGVGFDPAHAHRLFHVFERLHPSAQFQGTGVGLAIVQRIVEKHGGRVWAETRLGEGASFYFTLPSLAEGGGANA